MRVGRVESNDWIGEKGNDALANSCESHTCNPHHGEVVEKQLYNCILIRIVCLAGDIFHSSSFISAPMVCLPHCSVRSTSLCSDLNLMNILDGLFDFGEIKVCRSCSVLLIPGWKSCPFHNLHLGTPKRSIQHLPTRGTANPMIKPYINYIRTLSKSVRHHEIPDNIKKTLTLAPRLNYGLRLPFSQSLQVAPSHRFSRAEKMICAW